MKAHAICRVSELQEGQRKIVELEGKSIGIFNVGGEFHALRNLCPHQFAPLCQGKVTGYCEPSDVGEFHWTREGEIIRCPWHAWEFDLKTGRSIFNPHKVRTKSYAVTLEEAGDEASVESFPVSVVRDVITLHL